MSARKQRDASKERFWRRVLRQWQRSGLTVRAFCQQHGLAHCAAPRLGPRLECRSPGCYNADVCPEGAMSTLLAAYSYNALNRRIIEDDGTTETHLFYSADWQVLEEHVSGQTTTQYVWSPVYIDAMILRDRDTDSDGDLDERLYVQQDANWNVTALVDALTGNVVQRFVQDPFGLVTVLDSGFSPTADAFDWKYLHQGLRLDVAVGMNLYDGRNRIYDPVLQRWLQVDPSGFDAGDSNLYRYVGNNPVNLTDPSGQFAFVPFLIWGAIAIASGATVATHVSVARAEYQSDQLAKELAKPIEQHNEARVRELTESVNTWTTRAKVSGYVGLGAVAVGATAAGGSMVAAATPHVVSGAGAALTWTTTKGAAYVTTGAAIVYNYGTRLLNAVVHHGQRAASAVGSTASRVWEGARGLITRAPSTTAVLRNGYYEINGFRFSQYYYERLWATGRSAPGFRAESILRGAMGPVGPDPRGKAGFFRYVHDGWEMIYNPTTREVWHLRPL